MTKKCFKCGEIKLIEMFYVHSRMADGHLNKCKLCTKKDSEIRYSNPEALKRIIAYERERERDPARKALKLQYQRRMRLKSPGKFRARNKVMSAIRSGRITRKPCEVCGNLKSEAHHDDYRKYLNVKWLCRKHHMEHENKNTWL